MKIEISKNFKIEYVKMKKIKLNFLKIVEIKVKLEKYKI